MSHERKDYIYIFKDWALPEKNARLAAGIFSIAGGTEGFISFLKR